LVPVGVPNVLLTSVANSETTSSFEALVVIAVVVAVELKPLLIANASIGFAVSTPEYGVMPPTALVC